jgi:acetyl esterase/lipase
VRQRALILRSAVLGGCILLATILPPAVQATSGRYLNRIFANYTVAWGVVYGSVDNAGVAESLKLDLYQPAGDFKLKRPMVVYEHGGLCAPTVDKAHPQDKVVVSDLAQRGFVAVSINPRKNCTQAQAGDDMQAAVRWARANRYALRIDPAQIVVLGSSSGGVAAMDATFYPEDPGDSGHARYSSRVAAGVAIGGYQADPTKIGAGDPPIGLIHALDDTTVPIATSAATCKETREQGNVCEFFIHQSGGHPPGFVLAQHDLIVSEIAAFICRNVIGCPNSPPAPDDPLP